MGDELSERPAKPNLPGQADVIKRLSLVNRFGTVDEIAKAALWLCSDESSFTIGHASAVDGGYLAR